VVIHYFCFRLSWKIFAHPSIMNDSFSGQNILGLKLFSFGAQNTSLHAFLVFKFSVEKFASFF
jgi:hypothetical protein